MNHHNLTKCIVVQVVFLILSIGTLDFGDTLLCYFIGIVLWDIYLIAAVTTKTYTHKHTRLLTLIPIAVYVLAIAISYIHSGLKIKDRLENIRMNNENKSR